MTKPVDVDEKSFDQMVLEAKGPVLVDFWAPWCGPCRMVAPVVEELAQEYSGKVDFAKVNVDENPAVASRYGIRGIPTILIFKGGKLAQQVVGFRPKKELKKVLEDVLA
ncbi:MAG: thioredoxin [Chloroflexota bacterium]|nr:thioredoxin [Chloroflexota bacterium]